MTRRSTLSVIDRPPGLLQLGGDARNPIGAVRFLMNPIDVLGEFGIRPRPAGPRGCAGQPPVEAGTPDPEYPAPPLNAQGATVILDELEVAVTSLGSRCILRGPPQHLPARARVPSLAPAAAGSPSPSRWPPPPRAGRPAGIPHPRAEGRDRRPGPWPLARTSRLGLEWYSATASARNSGRYFDVPNGNSRPMDHHDRMIRVSTHKGKCPTAVLGCPDAGGGGHEPTSPRAVRGEVRDGPAAARAPPR